MPDCTRGAHATGDESIRPRHDVHAVAASSQTPYVLLIDTSPRRRWMRDMILSILLTSILTAILVCPLLAMSAIQRL